MATIRKRVLTSGKVRWVADFIDTNGRRHNRNFDRKKDAEAYIDHVKPQLREGSFVPDDESSTIAEAGRLFLKSAETRGVTGSTHKQYEQHVRIHINPRIGETRLTKLTANQVYEFIDEMIEATSPAMTKKVFVTLNAVLREARKRGLVGRNIIDDKEIKPPKVEAPVLRMPEKKELKALLEASEGWHRTFLLTAILTGMRKGELRALQWSEVDFEKGVIRVRRSATLGGTLKDTKTTAGRRDIPISSSLVHALKEWKLACPKGPLGLVFPNGVGKVENDGNISSRVFYPAMTAAELIDEEESPLFRFHDLRHAAAALFIEQGLDPKRIQTMMGHSSIKVTFDIYGYLFRNAEADAAAVDAIASRVLGA